MSKKTVALILAVVVLAITLYAYQVPDVDHQAHRAQLPEFTTVAAATSAQLTPANDHPTQNTYRDWHRSYGDATSSRYSSLDQINLDNVDQLRVAWVYHSGDLPEKPSADFSIQSNPLNVGDKLFFPTPGNAIVAVDVRTGAEVWRFKPEKGRPAKRGLAYWPGDPEHPARLFFTAGNYLYAVDPDSGLPIAEFGVGSMRGAEEGRARIPYTSIVAPAIFEHVIVVPQTNKDVVGLDLLTGERLWWFHTIPHPGEEGYETWGEDSYKTAPGANCWGGMAMDQERGIAYISTGSPKPNFIGIHHLGRNRFANSVIALDARTGERLWDFQEIRHDIWDLDIPAPPNLVTVEFDGQRVDAVAQVTKLGNTLLLDRLTGKPLYPFRMRRAPASKLPGEETWPRQPFIELPEPFSRQMFSLSEVTERTPQATQSVTAQLQNANYGWFDAFEPGKPTVFFGLSGGAQWSGAAFDPITGYLYITANETPFMVEVEKLEKPETVAAGSYWPVPDKDKYLPSTPGRLVYLEHCAACHGKYREGHLFNPGLHGVSSRYSDAEISKLLDNGLKAMPAYAFLSSTQKQSLIAYLFDRDQPQPTLWGKARALFESLCPFCGGQRRLSYTFKRHSRLKDSDGYPGVKPPWGTLTALDLNSGRKVWQVPLGEYKELTEQGIAKTGMENYGGPIVTAGGLVFVAGTPDNKIRAFNKATGEEVWEHELPFGGFAAPSTYEVSGKQYLSIPATGGSLLQTPHGDAYVSFFLDEP